MSSDAGASLDEHALETELQAAEREAAAAGRGWRSWTWINRPITIWILSTVAVGVLSFTYTQFSTCHSSLETDSSRFARLMKELNFRVGAVYGVAQAGPSAKAFLIVLDPDQQFLFTEFRNRLPNELVAEARQLLRKWHPSEVARMEALKTELQSPATSKVVPSAAPPDDDGRSLPTTIEAYVLMVLAQPARRLDVEPPLEAALPGGLFDLLEPWIVFHRTLPYAPSGENAEALAKWARALEAKAFGDVNDEWGRLGSTSICLRRAFWLFD